MKKIYKALAGLTLIALGSCFYVATEAFSDSSPKSLMTSVNVLGVNVLTKGGIKIVYLDDPGATSTLTYNLPPVSSNDGVIYMVKKGNTAGQPILLYPHSGDSIDKNMNLEWVLDQTGEYITFAADATQDSWWIVQEGYSGYEAQ